MTTAPRPSRIVGRVWSARDGSAAIEFVLVLPVLILLLFGTIDIGRLLADYRIAAQGIRDGARYLARADPADLGLDCGLGVVDGGSAPALAAMRLAMTGTPDGSAPYVLPYWTNSSSLATAGIGIAVTCVDNSGGTYRGLYDESLAVPSLTMSATVMVPLLNGWLLGYGADLPVTVRHREPHVGGRWGA
mgnify:CR=1 FL=1